MDVDVYTVLEGLAEICPTLVRALTSTPTFPQVNFVYVTPHRGIGKRTLKSLRSLSHDHWVPERDGTLTCVAGHLGGATHGSISEAVQIVIAAIF